MKVILNVLFAVAMITVLSQPINAAVVLFGEQVEFTGPGSYSAQIFIQASGQAEEIGGFNIQVDASNPNITFNSVVYNSAFESIFPQANGANPVQLQGTDLNFAGLALNEGGVGTLATLTFTVTAPGVAPLFGAEISDTFFGEIPAQIAQVGGAISFQSSVAVPEPSSFAFGIVGAVGMVARRRRRA